MSLLSIFTKRLSNTGSCCFSSGGHNQRPEQPRECLHAVALMHYPSAPQCCPLSKTASSTPQGSIEEWKQCQVSQKSINSLDSGGLIKFCPGLFSWKLSYTQIETCTLLTRCPLLQTSLNIGVCIGALFRSGYDKQKCNRRKMIIFRLLHPCIIFYKLYFIACYKTLYIIYTFRYSYV